MTPSDRSKTKPSGGQPPDPGTPEQADSERPQGEKLSNAAKRRLREKAAKASIAGPKKPSVVGMNPVESKPADSTSGKPVPTTPATETAKEPLRVPSGLPVLKTLSTTAPAPSAAHPPSGFSNPLTTRPRPFQTPQAGATLVSGYAPVKPTTVSSPGISGVGQSSVTSSVEATVPSASDNTGTNNLQSGTIALAGDARTQHSDDQLLSNHYAINVGNDATRVFYQYAVKVKPVPKEIGTGSGDEEKHLRSKFTLNAFTSNFKTEIITSAAVPSTSTTQPIRLEYYDEDELRPRTECRKYDVLIGQNKVVKIGQVAQYLRSGGLGSFASEREAQNAVDEAENALNVIISQGANEAIVRAPGHEPRKTFNGERKFYTMPTTLQFDNNGNNRDMNTNGYAWKHTKPGLIALPGYFRSTRALHQPSNPLLLNINTTTGAFYYGSRTQKYTVRQLIDAFRRTTINWEETEDFITGLRVMTTYMVASPAATPALGSTQNLERIFTISGLPYTHERPNQTYWDTRGEEPTTINVKFAINGVDRTVHNYFTNHHQAVVAEDDYVVRIGKSNFQPASNLFVLPGQPFRGKAEPVEAGSRTPASNLEYLVYEGVPMYSISPTLSQAFGVDVNTTPVKVDYAKLPMPTLQYQSQTIARGPSWNLRDRKFVKGASKRGKWSFVELYLDPATTNNNREIATVVDRLQQDHMTAYGTERITLDTTNVRGSNFQWNRHQYLVHNANDVQMQLQHFHHNHRDIKFLLVLIRAEKPGPAWAYNAVKRWGDLEVGLSTICLLRQRPKKTDIDKGITWNRYPADGTTLANLMLKINIRTDPRAANHTVAEKSLLLSEGTMLVGIDVTHPGGNYLKPAPSVASMVASTDNYFNQYPATLHLNPRPDDEVEFRQGQEEVQCLEEMLRERFDSWKHVNGGDSLPRRIIFFRDGLSMEQFEMCRTRELRQLQNCITKVYGDVQKAEPEILLICCVKRHHCRFYRPDSNTKNNHFTTGKENQDNPVTGVTVFQGVTYGKNQDFFLVSQDTIKGTTRPTHYVVLHNGIKTKVKEEAGDAMRDITIYDIAKMVYQLCWIYGPACKTVGLVPPAYFADRAADRARVYMEKVYNPPFANRRNRYDPEHNSAHRLLINPTDPELKHTMYYI